MMRVLCLLLFTYSRRHFLPFVIMFHSAFIIFNIVSSQCFFYHLAICLILLYIQHYYQSTFLTFDVLSRSAFITCDLMSFCRYLLLYVLSFWRFLPFDVLSEPCVPCDVLSVGFFHRQHFLLWHFVGDSYMLPKDELTARWVNWVVW